tara:strand:+ start:4144 stop:4272 length:129 start_codon:yes stop_codon:yes gene_type:complete
MKMFINFKGKQMKEKKSTTLYSTIIPIIAGLLAAIAHRLFNQ